MGFSGIGIWQLLMILAIVIMVFGTKKLRNMGGDIGSAIKGFKSAMGNDESKTDADKTLNDEKKLDVSGSPIGAKDVEKQKENG